MTRRAEVAAVAAALLLILLGASALAGAAALFERPLWLDEVHTALAASHASPVAVVHDVANGPDHAPPLLHLIEWSLFVATGSLSPAPLRVLSLLMVWLALGCTYATLRRRYDALPSMAGMLAVASNTLVTAHAFEARFYAPWLLFAAGFAWALGLDDGLDRSRRRDVALASFAILVCTVHWFGVITLALMCAAAVLAQRRDPRLALRRIAPSAAGVVALALCAPILLMQRGALTTSTWIPGPNGQQLWEMLRTFYVSLVPGIALFLLISRFVNRARIAGTGIIGGGIAAILALALMPVVIVTLSYLVQPTMLTRYAIVAALAWAPLVAEAVQGQRQLTNGAICLGLALLGYRNVAAEASQKAQFAEQVSADQSAFDAAVETGVPIVFQARHVLYPVAWLEPRNRTRMGFIAIPDETIDTMFPAEGESQWLRRFFRFERDVAAIHERLYAFPRAVPVSQLDSLPQFLLLASDLSLPRGYKDVVAFGRVIAPRHAASRLRENLTLFRRP